MLLSAVKGATKAQLFGTSNFFISLHDDSTAASINATTRSSFANSSSGKSSATPISARMDGHSGTINTTLCGRLAPQSTTWLMKRFNPSAFSIGVGTTYFPFSSLYCSLIRPVIFTQPSPSIRPRSPVWNIIDLPSGANVITSAVASGFFQYPLMTFGPTQQISPSSPGATGFPSSSQIYTVTPPRGRPIDPICLASGTLTVIMGDVSVKPYPSQIGIPSESMNDTTSCGHAEPPEKP
mmetsp:Transcript_49010/g.118719  ORF Transcript_49010/g.118719 Transcript_49010/m.118719 type:complete len:238 (-) Transcript_49010:1671-2384(-)